MASMQIFLNYFFKVIKNRNYTDFNIIFKGHHPSIDSEEILILFEKEALTIHSFIDKTSIAHGGCRGKGVRRI